MSSIVFHAALRRSIKFKRFRAALDVDDAYAQFYLTNLWLWATDHLLDKFIDDLTPNEVAEAAQWTGPAALFGRALVASGFVESDEQGRPSALHSWNRDGEFVP